MHHVTSDRHLRRRAVSAIAAFCSVGAVTLATHARAQDAALSPDAKAFCANIGDVANDARLAWQARTLSDLKSQVEEKTAALDTKRAELEEAITRYEAFRKKAEETIVDIYARMRPDAAATQLAALAPETAAAVLVKLNARVAGAILAEMDTPRAVLLAGIISSGGGPDSSQTIQQ